MTRIMPRKCAYEHIETLPYGQEFGHSVLYQFLEVNYPVEIRLRGDAVFEPQYKNDARWAIQDALRDGLVIRTGRGLYQRVAR